MNENPNKDSIMSYMEMLKHQIEGMTQRLNEEPYTAELEEVEELLEHLKIKYQSFLDTYPEMII